jgi:hypothetical protein
VIDATLHAVIRSAATHRSHPIVISRIRLQTDQAYPEHRLRVVAVEPGMGFRHLAQIVGIGAIVGDSVMLIVPARIRRSPPDDRDVIVSHFERWALDDLDMRSLGCRWQYLGNALVETKQTTNCCYDSDFDEPSVSTHDPDGLRTWTGQESWIAPMFLPVSSNPSLVSSLTYGIGLGPGVGATLHIASAQGGSGGVGMSNSLPCVAAEPPVWHVPVNVFLSG